MKDLVARIEELAERGVGFMSLQEAIDTTSAGGRLVFHVFGALAEFERELIRERTLAGLASARARGRKGGRPPAMDERKVKLASKLMADPAVIGRRGVRGRRRLEVHALPARRARRDRAEAAGAIAGSRAYTLGNPSLSLPMTGSREP